MSSARAVTHAGAVRIALFVTILWSSSWVLIRWGLDDESLAPITFASLRYGIAAAILLVWVLRRQRSRRDLAKLGRAFAARLVALGVLLYAVTQGALFVALAEQPAATTSLLLSLTPLFVAGAAALALSEVPTRLQAGGAVLVVTGAGLYFGGEIGATAAGTIAASVALGANIASSLLGRDINRSLQLDSVAVTGLSMGAGAAVLVAVGIGLDGLPAVSLRGWLIIGWLAIVNTALAFTLWNLSLRRLSAIESAGMNNTMLIQVALLAWLFLGEALGLVGLAGIVLVSAGVYLTQARRGSQD
ncbi:MAG: DMT family transporter [Chloroflexota bacterium]